jgi:NitT/TauT family transport system ATP-binding protein
MSVGIDVQGVEKVFATGPRPVHAIGPVDLRIAPGRFVSFVGPSGCGKSTLLLMIAGLLAPTRGGIEIDGTPVHTPYTNLGIVFQGHALVEWRSALDNVLLQVEMRGLRRRTYELKARELLASVGLGDFLDRHPWELSGGMQQRTALCRALVHDPPLILLDEPLGALDALTREQLRGDLERLSLRDQRTMVLVTHSIEEAVQLSDEVYVISPRPGRIVRLVSVGLERPRDLRVRQGMAFQTIVAEIKEIFLGYGLL